jgi:AsmA protein
MRKIAAALFLAGALVVGLLFVLPFLISSDWMRSELSRQLSSTSGMDIRLGGPVRLSFLPRPGVVAENIALSTGDGGVSMTVPRFSTAVTLSSLWSDRIEIQSIALVRPAITIRSPAKAETTQASPGQVEADPLAAVVAALERLAVNRITVKDGSLASSDAAGNTSILGAIDADLAAPDLDREVTFSFAATQQGRRVKVDGTLSALRPILKRMPADITVEARLDPSPVAEFSALKASGEIQLNANGGYQVRGGNFEVGGQSFRLDALFQPGERPRFLADLSAKRIDIGALASAEKGHGGDSPASGDDGQPSLAVLSGFDADISVAVDELVGGGMRASNVLLAATLRDGHLEAKLEHLGLDAGSLAATISTNAGETPPTIQGRIVSSGLDIGSMAKLFGQSVPLSGKLTVDAGFAFLGLTGKQMRESANLRGTVGIRQGRVKLAALAGAGGEPKDDVTGLNLDVKIQGIAKPADMAGKLTWRGQEVAFKSQITPAALLSGASMAQASVPVSFSIASKYLQASANGIAGGGGTFKGQVAAASPSVEKLMQWLGQTGSDSLQGLDFKGDVDLGPGRLSFQKATVDLNGVRGSGEGSVKSGAPLIIRTSLKFAKLDFAALAGPGDSAAGGKNEPSGTADTPIDLSFLKGLDAKIEIAADKMGYGKVFAGPVTTTLVVTGGTADLAVPKSPFYGGTIAARMTADGSTDDMPSIKLDMTIAGATAAPLLHDAAGFDRIEGKLDTNLAVTGAGKTTKSFSRSLAGDAAVKFSDGALRGIDVAEVYNNLAGLLSSGFKPDENKKTTFTELGASFALEKGVAHTKDIVLIGPLVRMDGSGQVDLAGKTLEIHLNPRIVASLTGQGGDIAAKGIGVPVIVDGSLSAPRIYPDLSSLMKDPKGALEMLSRFGLPTGKLDLDKLIPGQTDGPGTADLIGNLIKGGGKDGDAGSGLADVIGGALTGKKDDAGQPKTKTGDSGTAVKAVIDGLLKGRASQPDSSQAIAKPEPGLSSNGGAPAQVSEPVPTETRPSPVSPKTPHKDEIESLVDNRVR